MSDVDPYPNEDTTKRSSSVRWGVWIVIVLLVGGSLAIGVAAFSRDPEPPGAIGALTEPAFSLPDDVPNAALSDATAQWGLETSSSGGLDDPLGGGAALGDVDADGDLDLVVANGSTLLFAWNGDRFDDAVDLGVSDSAAVAIGDVDLDGQPDIVVARTGRRDVVLWGAAGAAPGSNQQRTDLDGGHPSGGVLIADLTGDGRPDILRLGRGGPTGTTDVIFAGEGPARSFQPRELPGSGRLSLAAELVDIDLDGLVDIWVTRDVGWLTGGDSLYSRLGDPTGPWVDISTSMGTALEIDGMGVTIGDLDGDADLDAYVSDIGDNEILTREHSGFSVTTGSGAARIRPPGTSPSTVSSSWASGVTDVNLDGIADLVVVNGGFPHGGVKNKIPSTDVAVAEPPAVLLGIGGGRFVDVWPSLGLDVSITARGMTIGDLDGDGDDDIVVITLGGRIVALRNDSDAGSITVTAGNGCVDAGAVITVSGPETTFQTLLAPHTYAGAHSAASIVGVGSSDVTVRLDQPGMPTHEQLVSMSPDRRLVELTCD